MTVRNWSNRGWAPGKAVLWKREFPSFWFR